MSIRSLLRNLFGRNRSAEPHQEPDARSAENAEQAAENSETATAESGEQVTAARTASDENSERSEDIRKSASNSTSSTNSAASTSTAGGNEAGSHDSSGGTTLTTDNAEETDDSGRVPTPRSAADDDASASAAAEPAESAAAEPAAAESADSGAKVTPEADRTESASLEPTSETDAFGSQERASTKRASGKTTSEDFLDSVASTTHDEYPRLSRSRAAAQKPSEPEAPEAPTDTDLTAVQAPSAEQPEPEHEPELPEPEVREPEPEPELRAAEPELPEPEVRPTEPTEASTAATPEASPNATAALSLEKIEATAPELVSLYKAAAVSLEKHGLAGQRAAVYLVLDRSGSMRRYYKDGTVQHLAEQVLGLSAHLDDDGTVPVVFFSTDIDGSADIELSNHSGRIGALHAEFGHMGRTNYHRAIETVIEHYERSGATDPALVIFQTDGAPTSRAAAEQALCEAADKPLFWQFVGFGDPKSAGLNFLRKLDSGLPVPEKRTVDNAGFFHAGLEPLKLSDSELYEALTEEFPEWLAAIRDAKIHP